MSRSKRRKNSRKIKEKGPVVKEVKMETPSGPARNRRAHYFASPTRKTRRAGYRTGYSRAFPIPEEKIDRFNKEEKKQEQVEEEIVSEMKVQAIRQITVNQGANTMKRINRVLRSLKDNNRFEYEKQAKAFSQAIKSHNRKRVDELLAMYED